MDIPVSNYFGRWRFLLLTLLICTWLVVTPQLAGSWPFELVLEALLLATVVVTLSANPGWYKLRYVLAGLWLVSVVGTVLSMQSAPGLAWQWYRTLELMTLVPVLAAVAAGMLAFVRRQKTLTADSIFATVAAYLLLAVLFAQIYLCLLTWDTASFALPVDAAERANHLLQADLTYFSVITMASVGYGDILANTPTARAFTAIQAVFGQFYVAVVVAVFVGMYSSQRRD